MPGRTYSAGTAFITVVPSFLGVEKAFRDQVRDMAAAADKDLAAGMAKGLDDINKQAKDRGARAGKEYAGAYESEAKKALNKAWQNLPEPKPDVNLSPWEKALGKVRQDMKELSSQRIGIDIDRETFDRAIDDFRKRLEQLRDTAGGPNKQIRFFDADEAAKELKAFQDFAEEVTRRAGTSGELAGSAFGQRMSQSLAAAIGKTPDIKVGADTSDAERALAELRVRMEELQSKRIGIDLDAGAAYAEVTAIKDALDRLDRRTVRADIRTNARAAAAELGQIVTAAEGAASSTEGIGTSANFSLSRLEALILLGASLGTVLVPAAAAAAGAIGALGTMAIGAGTGIGVFALAVSGVSDAVKALNNYQNASAKSTKSFNDANRSVASSTDQVRSAEQALANTRRTTAQGAQDAARRVIEAQKGVAAAERDVADARRQARVDEAEAARQVRNAQRDLTDAESNALDVRKALTQAIDDAKNSMAELNVQIKRNEQDQSVAVTAQMKALDELNKLRTNPRATAIELRQAEDAYNEQTVRIEELKVKHKELAEQQAKYAKDGVEADDQVIAARKRIAAADRAVGDAREKLSREQQQQRETEYRSQQRIADAQDRVAKAQDQVAQARQAQARQAQDAQYQLAQASQAVTAAQRAQQAAWDKTAVAGGSALDTLNAKMANLSPAQQHFAKFLFGLKDTLGQLQASAAEPLLPQLETAITRLLKYLPNVEAFISKVAATLGDIAVKAVDAFGNPTWQRFFNYIDKTAAPSLQTMFEVGENLTQGLINLFLALTPFNRDVGSGLVKLSQDFALWAERLDKTQGYRDFLQYVQENGPRVVHFLGEVGKLFIEIVKASAPMGSLTLKVLTALVDILNSLPTPVLTALVTTVGLLSLGFSGLGAVMRGIKFKEQLTDIFGPKTQQLVQKFAIDTGRATDETGKFGRATATVQGITAAGRDKVTGYANSLAQLPGRLRDATTNSTAYARTMSAVSTASSAVSSAVSATGNAVRDLGPRLAGATANAQAAAKNGLDRLKLSMLEVVSATNGPGGLAAGAQVAGTKLAGLGTAAANAATNLGGRIASGASTFAGALGNIATKAGAAAGAITNKLLKVGGSLVGLLGGPWGVAITAATVALGYFAAKSAEQKAKVESLKAALGELSTTYQDLAQHGNEAGASADEAFRNVVRNNPELQKAVIQLDKLGISFTEMVKAAASGDPSDVLKRLNAEIERNTKLSVAFDQANAAARGIYGANPYTGQIKGLKEVRDAFVQNAQAIGQAEQAERILTSTGERNIAMANIQRNTVGASTAQLAQMATQWDTNESKIGALNQTLGNFGNDAASAARRADDLTAAIQRQYGAAINANEATETWNTNLVNLRESVKSNGTTLDVNSRAGLANRDAIEAAAKSSRDLFIEEVRQGGKLPEVTAKHQDRINKLKDEAAKTFGAKSEAVKLIDTYGKIDPSITTKYSTQNFPAVFKQAQQLQFAQTMLELGITDPKEAAARWNRQQAILNNDYPQGSGGTARKATGGAISGPGTGTSDDVPILASDGEHMLTAAEVNAAGGHDAIYAWRQALMVHQRIPAPEELPRRAAGGAIERPAPEQRRPWDPPGYKKGGAIAPFIVDFSGTKLPTRAEALSKVHAPDGSFSGVLSPNETAARMQKFALAQRGKRYLWAAVGPDHYDCSGLTGDLWAIATGHKLYRRYMSTADMGAGRHNMVAGPGKFWTVYLGPGHTASNIAGLHAEAYGGNGTPLAIGHVGTRLSYYTQKLHLPGFAEGGAVDPNDLKTKRDRMISFLRFGWPEPPVGAGFDSLLDSPLVTGQFDAGGMLPPGYSAVVNNTGSPEPVLTSQQWQDISAIASRGIGRGGNTYQFSFLDTTLDPAKLREIQDREAVMARYDRAH